MSEGFLRIKQVLKLIPVSKTEWWRGVRSGKYPRSVKISKNVTAWRVEDIQKLMEEPGRPAQRPRGHRIISEGIKI